MCQRTPSDKFCGRSGYLHRFQESNRRRPVEQQKDWSPHVTACAARMTPARRAWVDNHLGLPAGASQAIPLLGCDRDGGGDHLVVPMHDGHGRVCGISRRYLTADPNGHYKKLSKGNNGLFVGDGWHLGQTLFIVEGASDVMAMRAMGLPAIGRPTNAGGVDQLCELLACSAQQLVIIGENDQKDDGLWPGLMGALLVSQQMASRLKRPVLPRLTPGGYKDVRAWVQAFGTDGDLFVSLLKLDEINVL
jgi:putative DNA primase/helicase